MDCRSPEIRLDCDNWWAQRLESLVLAPVRC